MVFRLLFSSYWGSPNGLKCPSNANNAAFVPLILQGQHVRLEPLTPNHRAGLIRTIEGGELWKLFVISGIPWTELSTIE